MSEETKNLETAATETQTDTAAETITEQNLDQLVTLKKGDKVKGTVIKIEDNQAYVSLGYKYDGVIPLRSCRLSSSTTRRMPCRSDRKWN